MVNFINGVPQVWIDDDDSTNPQLHPQLHFVDTLTVNSVDYDYEIRAHKTEYDAINNPNGFTFTRPADLTIDAAADVTCSYAGGCDFTVTAHGLTAALLSSEENSIDVCGNPCMLKESQSTAVLATCQLAPLVTPYSVENYSMASSSILEGKWTGSGEEEELAKLNDGFPTVNYEDTSSPCHFEF